MKFVGYTQTGYRLWDPIKRKIIISREVYFKGKKSEYITEEDKKKSRKGNKIYLQQEDSSDENEENLNDTEEDMISAEEDLEEDEENTTIIENDNRLPEQEQDTPRRSQRTKNFRTDIMIAHI